MTTKAKELKNLKLSEFLGVLLGDLRSAWARGVIWDMGIFVHADYENERACTICVAGALIIGQLDADCFSALDAETKSLLVAVDMWRRGYNYVGPYANLCETFGWDDVSKKQLECRMNERSLDFYVTKDSVNEFIDRVLPAQIEVVREVENIS